MRLKDVCYINKSSLSETTPSDYKFNYIDISNVTGDGTVTISDEMTFSEAPSRARRIIKKNDVIISTVRTYLKAISTITEDVFNVIASTGFAVCTPKDCIIPSFLSYSIKADDTIDEICKESTGVSYPAITATTLSSISIPFYDTEKQSRIVSYLDNNLEIINNRIATFDKKVSAYTRLKASIINRAVTKGLNTNVKLKDSGIDWIGEIPINWNTKRLKDISFLYSGLTGKAGDDFRCEDATKTKPYIPFTNVLNNTVVDLSQFNYVVMKEGEEQNRVKENDLIFLMSSEDYESIAKSAVVLGDPGEVYLNSFCRGLRFTSEEVFPPFVNYQLLAEKYRDALRFEARGFTRINIKMDRIASQFISLPPLSEQKEIASYLDEKCAKIDAAIANIEKQIDALKRLKRALINEVVTGKKEV